MSKYHADYPFYGEAEVLFRRGDSAGVVAYKLGISEGQARRIRRGLFSEENLLGMRRAQYGMERAKRARARAGSKAWWADDYRKAATR